MNNPRLQLKNVGQIQNADIEFGDLIVLVGPQATGKSIFLQFLRLHLFFLWISSIQLALQRIKTRVRNGGHDVPEGVVRRRLGRSLSNLFNYYQPLAESWTIFDNSGGTPKMIAFEESGKREVLDPVLFNLLLKHTKKQ